MISLLNTFRSTASDRPHFLSKIVGFIAIGLLFAPLAFGHKQNLTSVQNIDRDGLCALYLKTVQEAPGTLALFTEAAATKSIFEHLFYLEDQITNNENLLRQGKGSSIVRSQLRVGRLFQEQIKPLIKSLHDTNEFHKSHFSDFDLQNLAEQERTALVSKLNQIMPTALSELYHQVGMGGDSVLVELGPAEGMTFNPESLYKAYMMYKSYAKSRGWSLQIVSSDGEILDRSISTFTRTATLKISGPNAATLIGLESGTHRFVRAGEPNGSMANQNRTHTNYVEVRAYKAPTPEEFRFDLRDVTITFTHASGNGGQNVNKVETAVQAVHGPSGLRTKSSQERTQSDNRRIALEILRAKVFEWSKQKAERERQSARDTTLSAPRLERYVRTYDERYPHTLDPLLTGNLNQEIYPRLYQALAFKLQELARNQR